MFQKSFTVTGVVGSEGEGCFSVLRSGDILISFSLSASCEVLRPKVYVCVYEKEEEGRERDEQWRSLLPWR